MELVKHSSPESNRRILVIDGNRAIHDDFSTVPADILPLSQGGPLISSGCRSGSLEDGMAQESDHRTMTFWRRQS
jgi:hypothetical protein